MNEAAPRKVRVGADLARLIKSRKLAPTIPELRDAFPQHYREEVRPDGSREAIIDVPNHVNGVRTKDGLKLEEIYRPYIRSETSRARARKPRPKIAVIDRTGARLELEPHVLNNLQAQGVPFRPVLKTGGMSQVRAGRGGMLFRYFGGSWMPTGRWCLSKPWLQAGRPEHGRRDGSMRPKGLQYDPDGEPWRYVAGEWRPL